MYFNLINKIKGDFYEPTISKKDRDYFYSYMRLCRPFSHLVKSSFFVTHFLFYYFIWNELELDIKTAWITYSKSLCFKVSPRLCYIGQNIGRCIALYNAQKNETKIT